MNTIPANVSTVAVILDQPRHLCLDFNALALIERVTGDNVLTAAFWEAVSATRLITVIYACLLREDPSITEWDVGGWVHSGNMQMVLESVMKLYNMAMNDREDSQNGVTVDGSVGGTATQKPVPMKVRR